MKVLFLIVDRDGTSSRCRVLQFLPLLDKEGIQYRVEEIPDTKREKRSLLDLAREYEVTFLQKRLFGRSNLDLLRRRARRLVFDFDNAVMYRDFPKEPYSSNRMRRFSRTIRTADLVIAGNDYLLEEAQKYTTRVIAIPTVLDQERYLPKVHGPKNIFTLGWIGSENTLFYLKKLKSVLQILSARFKNLEVKIVSDLFLDFSDVRLIKKTRQYDEEIEDLHSFDIGLMPLDDDLWSRGNCGFNVLQSMVVGLPVVCSPIGVNRKIVQHGKNGFWAFDEEAWVIHISGLIENSNLRIQMGEEARKTVLDGYSLQRHGGEWVDALKNLGEGV